MENVICFGRLVTNLPKHITVKRLADVQARTK